MHSHPGQGAAIPAVTQQRADYILAARQQTGHIVSLIQHAFAIVGEVGRQDIRSHAPPIQEHTVASERSDVESGASHLLRYGQRSAQVSSRLLQWARIAEAFVRQIPYHVSRLPMRRVFEVRLPSLTSTEAHYGTVSAPDLYQRRQRSRRGFGPRVWSELGHFGRGNFHFD